MSFLSMKIVSWLLRPWFKEISGREHLPTGAFVIAANHKSFADSVMITTLLTRLADNKIHFYASDKYTRGITGLMMRLYETIPVRVEGDSKREINDIALSVARNYLASGEIIAIYPEGRISRTDHIESFKSGVVTLAELMHVPVVPVGINGTERFLPYGAWIPRFWKRISVRIGKPISIENPKKDLKKIREEIGKLSGYSLR